MSDPLESARIKLKRANLHVSTAKREMFRFFKAHEQPTFDAKPYGATGPLTPGNEFAFTIFVTSSSYPDLPDSFGARFGDAIHNYRSVLDHITWQLVSHRTTPPTTLREHAQRAIQFPCYGSETAFKEHIRERLPGVARTVIDYIHSRYAYDRGQATNEPLLALAKLSNDDKHRTIHAFVSALAGIQHQHTFTRCKPIEFIPPSTPQELETNAVIGTFRVIVLAADPKVEMGLTPQLYVVLEDGRPMLQTLNLIREQVETILNAPEIAAAL